jgi:formylglycine-generating enzyme required for sulfatase activity
MRGAVAVLLAALGLVACVSSPERDPAGAILAATRFVDLTGGRFRMGDVAGDGGGDERPVHEVVVAPFGLATTEVTVGQFARFVAATGYRTDAESDAGGKAGCAVLDVGVAMPEYRAGTSWRDPGFPQDERHPVVCLSFADVQAFIVWLSGETGRVFRLPTEAEWEYAARAGSETAFPWGADADEACAYANGADETPGPAGQLFPQRLGCRDGYVHTAPAGSFRPNAFGLQDMIGNAWEWTADCYHRDYAGAPADGRAWVEAGCGKRVIRGGGWPYPAGFLRTANRGGSAATLRANDRGFRLAR